MLGGWVGERVVRLALERLWRFMPARPGISTTRFLDGVVFLVHNI